MIRPNIVYLHSHDTGRLISPYGYPAGTPNLQRLAEEGVLWRQAHCAAPTCSPSRAALLTGQSPHRAGMFGLAHRGFALSDYTRHLNHMLKRAGYTTALAGIQHIARPPYADPAAMGYDRMLNHDSRGEANRGSIEQAAVDYLASAPAQPFFLDVGFFETHRLGSAAGTFVDRSRPMGDARYILPPPPLPDTPEVRQDIADYFASAAVLDRKMGQVLEAMERHGLADNTLVICTTDHGIAFPGMKCNLTSRGTGVMLIMRGSGGFRGGQVFDALVSHIDIFPTLCELLGIEQPSWLEGRSLMPIVRGEVAEVNDAVFAEVTYHAAYQPMRCIRTQGYSYTRRFGDLRPVLPNTDDSLTKSVLFERGWADAPHEAEELYDLALDPGEMRNIAKDPRHREVIDSLRERLQRWMEETRDPLLNSPVAVPSGAVVTPGEDYSPGGGGSPDAALAVVRAPAIDAA